MAKGNPGKPRRNGLRQQRALARRIARLRALSNRPAKGKGRVCDLRG